MNIRIGTDCSGIEAPVQALKKLKKRYGITYEHIFSSEIDPYAIKFIKANYKPKILYGDIKKRDVSTIPEIDLYVAGFSCQPYSLANKFKTPVDPRLNLYESCVDVIFEKQPSCFLLENVQTLTTLDGGSYFKDKAHAIEYVNGGDHDKLKLSSHPKDHNDLDTRPWSTPSQKMTEEEKDSI